MTDRTKCRTCNGTGKTPMATMALAIPPRERRELNQTAADNPVDCYACGGSGEARDLYARPDAEFEISHIICGAPLNCTCPGDDHGAGIAGSTCWKAARRILALPKLDRENLASLILRQ